MNKTPTESAIIRFFRVFLAYAIVLVIKLILKYLDLFNLPDLLIPVLSALLNAIAKYIRDKYNIDIII
ncbi:MAG: hypothetical protein QW734_10250 [Candidatus Bathyarchaeia archaeon]